MDLRRPGRKTPFSLEAFRWRAKLIDRETALMVREQISGPLPGWFQFRPLWDQIIAEEPDLID